MKHFDQARCLVTGASSGLGRALATQLAEAGARVLATGRSGERLDDWKRAMTARGASADRIGCVAADLTSEDDRVRLVLEVSERFDGAVDLVVQCAGVGAYGRFMSHEPAVLRQLVEVNFLALAELARGVYPLLRRGREPSMVAMGSIVARRGLPGRSEYSASKFAVAGWVEAVRAEWSRDKIHILLVNPGFTRTEFEQHLLIDTAFHKVEHRRTQSPEQVARATLRAVVRRKLEITPAAFGARLLLSVNRLMPRFVDRGLARWTRKLYSSHNIDDLAG